MRSWRCCLSRRRRNHDFFQTRAVKGDAWFQANTVGVVLGVAISIGVLGGLQIPMNTKSRIGVKRIADSDLEFQRITCCGHGWEGGQKGEVKGRKGRVNGFYHDRGVARVATGIGDRKHDVVIPNFVGREGNQ